MFIAFEKIWTFENFLYLLKGLGYSLLIAIISLIVGFILAILANLCLRSKNVILKGIAKVYVEIIRGTPQLLQILIIYSVIPSIYTAIFGKVIRINVYLIGIIALSINSGAYQTELIRAGINSVKVGQWEAGQVLGLSYKQIMFNIILPQAIKNIVPPIISELITLIKDSSLISSIGAIELLKRAEILGSNYYDIMSAYCLAAILYLTITIIFSYIGKLIEKRLNQHA